MYSNIVFSGGALKGVSFIGCLRHLENLGIIDNFKNILGSSSGSIMALFVVLNYTSYEIETFVKTSFVDVFDIKMKNMLTFFKNYGLDNGDRIVKLVEKILEFKNVNKNITFIELTKIQGKNIIIASANLSKSRIEYFSVDNYGNMMIKNAIRMSVSIPFLFKPIIFESNYFVDAFIYNNFPIEFFKKELKFTIGIKIKTEMTKITSFIDFIAKIFTTMLDRLTLTPSCNENSNIYEILTTNYGGDYTIKAMKLDIKTEMIDKYITDGYEQFKSKFSMLKEV